MSWGDLALRLSPRRSSLVVLGALAVAVLAAGAAFACIPLAGLRLSQPASHGGTVLVAHGWGFKPALPVVLRWNGVDGPELARTTNPTTGVVELPFTVPAVLPGRYVVVALQHDDQGLASYGTPARVPLEVLDPSVATTTTVASTVLPPLPTPTTPVPVVPAPTTTVPLPPVPAAPAIVVVQPSPSTAQVADAATTIMPATTVPSTTTTTTPPPDAVATSTQTMGRVHTLAASAAAAGDPATASVDPQGLPAAVIVVALAGIGGVGAALALVRRHAIPH